MKWNWDVEILCLGSMIDFVVVIGWDIEDLIGCLKTLEIGCAKVDVVVICNLVDAVALVVPAKLTVGSTLALT